MDLNRNYPRLAILSIIFVEIPDFYRGVDKASHFLGFLHGIGWHRFTDV
jgi:hypothetical protein